MSVDPIRDFAEWSGMTPEWEARIAHPAGKSLKSEQRMDDEAMRLANGEPWWSRRDWCDWIIGAGVGLLIFLTISLFSMSAAVIGGWVL